MSELLKVLEADIHKKQGKYVARSYFNYQPEKGESEINTYSNGKINTVKTNDSCYLYTNYFKMLVQQKINYLLAKQPELKIETEKVTGAVIVDMLEDVLLTASLDTTAWLHLYVENGVLDWILVNDREIIPVYDKYKKNIVAVIRYFLEDKETYRVETWALTGVKVEYIVKDKLKGGEVLSHYQEETFYNGESVNVEGKNLPFIPFIPMFNNKQKKSDLDGIQELIDMYTSINSGFVDNINLFQEAIVKLKGFSGDTEELETIRKNMQKYKMVGLPSGGSDGADMEYMSIEIPVEARRTMLDLLKENIFKIGQGLDPDRMAGESNITNVVIKSRYSSLDMKVNGTEKQLRLFYEKFVDCLNAFYRSNEEKDITFNRSMIFNEVEAIDNCIKSTGLLSVETVLENHPFVKNVKEELKRIAAEKKVRDKEVKNKELTDVKAEEKKLLTTVNNETPEEKVKREEERLKAEEEERVKAEQLKKR